VVKTDHIAGESAASPRLLGHVGSYLAPKREQDQADIPSSYIVDGWFAAISRRFWTER
jgi:hypothetical protein